VEIRERIAVILCLGIGLASSGLTVAQSSAGLGQEMSHADREPPGDCTTSIFYSDAGKSIIES
jgi:hypothetical protein